MTRRFDRDLRPLHGETRLPGDKSISHRAILFAAMAEGVTPVSGVLDSRDVRSTAEAVRSLGATVSLIPDAMGTLSGFVRGWGSSGPTAPSGPIDCGNSGTTARLLMGVLAGAGIDVELVGDASLSGRPMRRVTDLLARMGARIELSEAGTLPARILPADQLSPVQVALPVASAQVKSAVLLAGLSAHGCTEVTEPAPSRDHTELLLPAFGVSVDRDGLTCSVEGPASLVATDVRVPGDPSSAAFIAIAAAMVPGSSVMLRDVSLNTTRTGFLEVMGRMGAHVEVLETHEAGREPYGTVRVAYTDGLTACDVAPHEIASLIDEIPVLALLATAARGTTRFHEAGELRVKESDRLAATVAGLGALGCTLRAEGDDLVVEGGLPSVRARLDALDDHRLAMTWALAGMVGAGVDVDGFESVDVSFPAFVQVLERLRG